LRVHQEILDIAQIRDSCRAQRRRHAGFLARTKALMALIPSKS
jgi:hypothetical protein